MNRRDVDLTLPWMGAGTALLLRAVDALPDDALADPSTLPGWSRAHVVGHVARNAEALTRLATWARTGVESPMYASAEQRAEEIEKSAKATPETLRRELADTADTLDSALAALDGDMWQAQVRTALGRAIPATELPWMRVREVWLHAVDLDAGVRMDDLPPEVVDSLLDDVTAVLSTREGCPAALLVLADRDRTWSLGGDDANALEVGGDAAEVLGWLIGRSGGERVSASGDLPVLPRWL
jgi:maleylpyruvate isomerase